MTKQVEINSGVAEFILVDSKGYITYSSNHNVDGLLGLYTPSSNEIDFEAKGEWVEIQSVEWVFDDECFVDYLGKAHYTIEAKELLLSLLKRDTEKAFTWKENPYGKEKPKENPFGIEPFGDFAKLELLWEEAEAKVMPAKFAVIHLTK